MDFFRFRFCTWVCRKAGNVWNPQLKASVVKCVCCAIWWDVITWIDVVCSMYCNYIIDHRLTDVIMISYQNFSEKKSSFNKTVQPMRLTTTSEARNRRTDWPLYFTAEDPAPISVGTHRADRRSGWMIATSIQCSNRYMCWDQRFQKKREFADVRCHDVSFSFFDASWICHFVGELFSVSVLLGVHSCGVIKGKAMKLILCTKAWLAQTFVRRKLHCVEVCWFYCILVPLGLFWLHACFYNVFLSLLMSLYYDMFLRATSHMIFRVRFSLPNASEGDWAIIMQQLCAATLLTGCAVHRSRLTYR